MKKSSVFALVALCGVAPATFAQEPLSPVEQMVVVSPVGYPANPYTSRAIGTVYNNGGEAGTNTNGTTLGVVSWADEYDFSVGPWATAPTRLATEIILWVQSSGTACPAGNTQTFDILADFYDAATFSYNNNPMNGAAPFESIRVAATGTCGVQTGFIINLTGLPNGGVVIPGSSVYVQYRLVETGTNTLRPHPGNASGTQSNFPVFGIGTTLVGQSSPSYCRDVDGDQIMEGGTPVVVGAGTGHEHRRTSTTLNTNQRSRIRGDIPPPPIPTHTDLGSLADSGAQSTTTLAAGEVKWFGFNLMGDATDAALQFLDISAEGSTHADLAYGLFRSDGSLVAFDLDDGTALNPQLTFGVGRRPSPGSDARQFDGRDGQVTAATYYIAVSAGNASFADGFSVSNPSVAAGDVTLSLSTNTNGSPLAAAVPPDVPPTQALGQLFAPGTQAPGLTIPRSDVVWYTFEICNNADGAEFLDVDFSRSTISADTEVFVFDSNGNLLVQNDDADADGVAPFYTLSQLSFGNVGPRPALNANAQAFAGQEGPLPVGTYYVGVGLFNTAELAAAATAGRWHLRSASGSSLPVQLDFYTSITACASTCGSADFDGDGDTGTDADIEAFFACLGGNCCGTCGTADFDGDGDTGTDADIEAFFRVLGGGNC